MNIVLDASVLELPPTGIAKVTAGLSHASLARDPELTITAVHRRPLRQTFTGRCTSRTPGRWLPSGVWRSLVLPRVMRRADVTWFPWNGNVPKLHPAVTVVSIIHDVLPLIIPDYFASTRDEEQYRFRIQRDLDRSHLVFTDSSYSQQQILSQFRVSREPIVIRFGPTITPLKEPLRPAEMHGVRPFFVYVGGYDRRKGIEGLVSLFCRLHEENRLSSRLILTGTPNYFSDSFREQVKIGVAKGIVEEAGYVDEATLASLFHQALALVYPSKYEGFGLPPLEAMTAGCPVITTRQTSLPEVCGDAAVYIDPDDMVGFAEALITLERDPDARKRAHEKGLRQAATFSWDEAATTFLQTIHSTVQKRGRP
jgi:glycosyltransferase involved in cell wall biosynthesis